MEVLSKPMPAYSILLAEDNRMALTSIVTILSRKFPDVRFFTAYDGKMGLELFKSHLPDIVISDIKMPEIDGIQMVKIIRTLKADTKFIILTGTSGKTILEASVKEGLDIDHFIEKPVIFHTLFTAVDQCLGEISA